LSEYYYNERSDGVPISIGDKVIKRRKEVKMTQSELAKDICTQSQVSRIEKNEIMPSSETLFLIANKLNVSMDYFFGVEKVNNVIRGKKICQDYLEINDFETLEVFIDAQLQTVLTEYEHQYFSWIKAVCIGQNRDKLHESIARLESLSNTTINVDDPELDASIYNSLSIFYRKVDNIKESDRAINKAKSIIKKNMIYNETAVKVYYQYANLLMIEEKYSESLESAQQGLEICLENNLLYLMDNLIYFICGAKQDLGIITDKDRELYDIGYGIAKLKNNVNLIDLYEQELVEYNHLKTV